ncbi:unnamed protein product [Protopolystoma xenopodis]|uniref:Uncharacterized protein n=1 Tax=Protopolystoma xenopodis TaxID=117903 RepID=A0A448XEG0_9PLAT|nr:unnamed protein product [Protopolystoma xenopodis]
MTMLGRNPDADKGDPEEEGLQVYRAKLIRAKAKLRILAERSTFHGIDIILETRSGYRRIMVVLIVLSMCLFSFYGVSIIIGRFLNAQISTVVNYNQQPFQFPAITVCPDSPFSVELLQAQPDLYERLPFNPHSSSFGTCQSPHCSVRSLICLSVSVISHHRCHRIRATQSGMFYSLPRAFDSTERALKSGFSNNMET